MPLEKSRRARFGGLDDASSESRIQALSVGIGLGELKQKKKEPPVPSFVPTFIAHEPIEVFSGERVAPLAVEKAPMAIEVTVNKKDYQSLAYYRFLKKGIAFAVDIVFVIVTVGVVFLVMNTLFKAGTSEVAAVGSIKRIEGQHVGAGLSLFYRGVEFLRDFSFMDLFFGSTGIFLIYFFLFRILMGFTLGEWVEHLLVPMKKRPKNLESTQGESKDAFFA